MSDELNYELFIKLLLLSHILPHTMAPILAHYWLPYQLHVGSRLGSYYGSHLGSHVCKRGQNTFYVVFEFYFQISFLLYIYATQRIRYSVMIYDSSFGSVPQRHHKSHHNFICGRQHGTNPTAIFDTLLAPLHRSYSLNKHY